MLDEGCAAGAAVVGGLPPGWVWRAGARRTAPSVLVVIRWGEWLGFVWYKLFLGLFMGLLRRSGADK